MRNLSDVIDQLLTVIPSDHDVVPELKSIQQSAKFAAPEMLRNFWILTADALQEHLGPPDADWKREVQRLFKGDADA
jgi:hypothetical protein